MANPKDLMAMIVQSIQVLAADYETQKRLFPGFVVLADEIALGYADAVEMADQLTKAGLISEQQLSKMKELDCILDGMSDDASYWTTQALQGCGAWREVRTMAKGLLELLGQPICPPARLSGIVYVRHEGDKSNQD